MQYYIALQSIKLKGFELSELKQTKTVQSFFEALFEEIVNKKRLPVSDEIPEEPFEQFMTELKELSAHKLSYDFFCNSKEIKSKKEMFQYLDRNKAHFKTEEFKEFLVVQAKAMKISPIELIQDMKR